MTERLFPQLAAGGNGDFTLSATGGEAESSWLGEPIEASAPVRFVPPAPATLQEAGLGESDVEALILKLLLTRGTTTARAAASQLHLPRQLVVEALERLRDELLVAIKVSSGLDDFVYQLTEAGFERARRLAGQCSYVGPAPVPVEAYIEAVHRQSLAHSRLNLANLKSTFQDYRIGPTLISQLGQAINDGRGLFLFGPPGNGKTSIAERVVSSLGEFVWVPHAICIDGEMVRLFDPRSHVPVDVPQLAEVDYDQRWVLVHRPTIVVGGELMMEQLDLQLNNATGICEAPVQMRANCGALVIDDFGRQRMPTSEILNRLIVPMEKQHDYLNLASGRQISVPFDLLLVFSTNLEPSALVDEAFLRRIPYKIEVQSPDEQEFCDLFIELSRRMGCECDRYVVRQMIERHYHPENRPLRFCHPRDLLRQVQNYCQFHGLKQEVTAETLDVAVAN